MRSLTKNEYLKILRRMEFKGYSYQVADQMKAWDEARTDLNPNARWYDDVEEQIPGTGIWIGTAPKDKFICSACREKFKIPSKMGIPMWRFCPICGSENVAENY